MNKQEPLSEEDFVYAESFPETSTIARAASEIRRHRETIRKIREFCQKNDTGELRASDPFADGHNIALRDVLKLTD